MYERTSFHQTCRGSGDGMQAKGTIRNTGSPSGELTGMAEWLVVPRKPGNSGGGRGPQLKADARSDEGTGDWR